MLRVDERRLDAHVVSTVDEPCRTDQPHDHLELARRGDVDRVDLGDPGVVDVLERDARVERDRREDRHLRGGVGAGDVVGRIRFRVPACLRVRERLRVRRAAFHLREHEVRRAVDDPEHAMDVRDDERLPQHLDHRDRRAHARLEAKLHAARRRGGEELRRAASDELLVGGHDVLAALEQGEDIRPCRLEPAHRLGDDGDRRVVRDLVEVGREQAGGRSGMPAGSRTSARTTRRR